MIAITSDPPLNAISERLATEFQAHTAILYGSRAHGEAATDSDYDVIAFRDGEERVTRESGMWHDALLDIFVYPTSVLDTAGTEFLHARGGIVLFQRGDLGDAFLRRLDEMQREPPQPLPEDEIAAQKVWAWKMLARAARGDIEGNYRRAWLVMSQLENHFIFNGEWYPGSKRAFDHLRQFEPDTYQLFEMALEPAASLEAIETLVSHINGPRPWEEKNG